jgi:hypothetical protein
LGGQGGHLFRFDKQLEIIQAFERQAASLGEIPEAILEPVAKLTAEEPGTDDGASHQHQCLMGERILFLPRFQFSKLVQP